MAIGLCDSRIVNGPVLGGHKHANLISRESQNLQPVPSRAAARVHARVMMSGHAAEVGK